MLCDTKAANSRGCGGSLEKEEVVVLGGGSPHQDNESSPKFSATLDQRSNRLQPALHHNSNLVHVCQ